MLRKTISHSCYIILVVILNYYAHAQNFSCLPKERLALARFRQTLFDPFGRLSSWNNTTDNCCIWDGITCDNVTGHVIGLDLRNAKYETRLVGERLDSSLLDLKNLTYLDLSYNNFQLSPIPTFLGSMNRLQVLNLSFGNFSGLIPHQLGYLNGLRALNLNFAGRVRDDDLTWVSNLTLLEFLDLSVINLTRTKDLIKVFGALPSLTKLVLTWTGISSENLSPNPCPNPSRLASIQQLHLSWNAFKGEFPCFLLNMTWLKVLGLSNNALTGPLPASLGNLTSLTELYLSYNAFSGSIPTSFTNLTALTQLHLSSNNLSGSIPPLIGNMIALKQLSLNGNKFIGEIPASLGQLSDLESFDVSWNAFNGTLSRAHLGNLSKLEWLSTDYNMLKLSMGTDWVPPFQIKHFSLSSTEIGGRFPEWLKTQNRVVYLDLTNTSISGTLPGWLSSINYTELYAPQNNLVGPIPDLKPTILGLDLSDNTLNGSIPLSICQMKYLDILDLSKNRLSGTIPNCIVTFPYITMLRLSNNELTGIIPNSFESAQSLLMLHLSYNKLVGQIPSSLRNCTRLVVLDVGDNMLSENLPEWVGEYLLELVVLRLRGNKFSGTFPSVFCHLSKLQILDLADNYLTGKILTCFGHFPGMIKGTSSPVIPYPHWDDESYKQVLKGSNLEYIRTSTKYVVNMDISSNRLSGQIPVELTNLSALIGFNLSNNNLGGRIPALIGNMKALESIDLSENHLFGDIPQSLSQLTSLSHMNLSNNNLSGEIPTGNQLQTLNDPSIYGGNPGLCGPPLAKKCPKSVESPGVKEQGGMNSEDDDDTDKIYFYGFLVGGFATGFWGLVGVALWKNRWRKAYDDWMEKRMRNLFMNFLHRYSIQV